MLRPNGALLAALVLGATTLTGCVVQKRRAALVPHMVPAPRSGQNIYDGRGQVYLENSVVTHMRNPREAPDANAGLLIPRFQIGGGARLRLAENWDIGFLFEAGLRAGAMKVAPDVPPGPERSTYGFGFSVGYSIRATSFFRIGLVGDVLAYAVPYKEYLASECTPPTFEDCRDGENHLDWVPVFSLSVIPSFKVTRWLTLFLGLTLRNHPTIPKESFEFVFDDDGDVEAGPPNFTIGVGAEFQLHQRVRFMVHAYYPVTKDPVIYYPVIGAGLTVSFGTIYRKPCPPKPQPPVYPPGPGVPGTQPPPPGGTQPPPHGTPPPATKPPATTPAPSTTGHEDPGAPPRTAPRKPEAPTEQPRRPPPPPPESPPPPVD